MKTKNFGILYFDRGQFRLYNNDTTFSSVEAAKKEIDNVRAAGVHALCLNHRVVIHQFDGKLIVGNGIRY